MFSQTGEIDMDEVDNNAGTAESRDDCTVSGLPLGPAAGARMTDPPRTKTSGAKTPGAKNTGAGAPGTAQAARVPEPEL